MGHLAKFGILIARTDPDVAKHEGISYFICPMDAPGHRGPADHRDDRRPHVQRGVLHRRAHPGREPGRRRERRLVAGQGHARQRAGVAVVRRACSGAWARRRSTCSTRCGPTGGCDDPLLRQRLAALHTEAKLLDLIRLRTVIGARSRASSRARRRRSARSSPTSTASRSWRLAKDLAGAARRCSPAAPDDVGLRLPVRARRSPSAAAPARCSATSSPSGCSACPTTSTSRPARPGPRSQTSAAR